MVNGVILFEELGEYFKDVVFVWDSERVLRDILEVKSLDLLVVLFIFFYN